jgi:hypothetical protein
MLILKEGEHAYAAICVKDLSNAKTVILTVAKVATGTPVCVLRYFMIKNQAKKDSRSELVKN